MKTTALLHQWFSSQGFVSHQELAVSTNVGVLVKHLLEEQNQLLVKTQSETVIRLESQLEVQPAVLSCHNMKQRRSGYREERRSGRWSC